MSIGEKINYREEHEVQPIVSKKKPSAKAVSIFKQKPFTPQIKMLEAD